MSSEDIIPVTVHILDKEYRIGCKDGEQQGLLASAQYLDRQMREIRQSGKVIGTDRIAVMAALNITFELLEHRKTRSSADDSINDRIQKLQKRIELALSANRQLDL